MTDQRLNIIGIIPARMGSSRFPGKPLAKILGMPMIGHVYFRSKMSKSLKEVYIVTPDNVIADYARSIGAKVVVGRNDHPGCSDITAEAMLKIEKETGERLDIVVMIQGDEPMITPEMMDMAIKPFKEDPSLEVVNLMAPIKSEEEHNDPSCPKVVVDQNSFALYFSREPIPSKKKWDGKWERKPYKQVCIIPFTRDFLLQFNLWTPTPLERIESIDMNRVLEYGHKVKMIYEEYETYPVDTPADLQRAKEKMISDPLVKNYA
ncbi:MAG: 3-deoxy-manno-octulosonate cytidylyltransferase [Candidatus Zambryskibacteria bacterium]|nr:3-deoxy-manno-octulosonate cytidylyltransferase [Candidatus Zambryskibacteria bacterium]